MNNKIVIAIIAIIVVAAGAFLLTRKADSPSTVESNTEAVGQAGAETSVETGSIKSLISRGGNQKCTFTSKDQGGENNGTVYVSGGKMRGDFAIESSGVNINSHMIYDGTTSYVWTDGQNQGFKMALDTNEQASSSNQSVDTDKNYEYTCERWSVDNSKFELPGGVEFKELPSFSTGVGASGGSSMDNMKAIQLDACNKLPEPAKAQCIAAIK